MQTQSVSFKNSFVIKPIGALSLKMEAGDIKRYTDIVARPSLGRPETEAEIKVHGTTEWALHVN